MLLLLLLLSSLSLLILIIIIIIIITVIVIIIIVINAIIKIYSRKKFRENMKISILMPTAFKIFSVHKV